MAYKQGNPLVKLVIFAGVLWAGWQYGVPWAKGQGLLGGRAEAVQETPNATCVSAADEAVATWSQGIVRFMNPPIEPGAWSQFRADVSGKIDQTHAACGCPAESCTLAKEVVRDLKLVLLEMDSAARTGGPPPSDLVRSQESIDLKIERAWKLVDAGK